MNVLALAEKCVARWQYALNLILENSKAPVNPAKTLVDRVPLDV